MKSKPSKINKEIVYVKKLTCMIVESSYNITAKFDSNVNDKDGKKFKISKRYTFDKCDNITNVRVSDRKLISGIRDRLNDTYRDFNFSTTDIILKTKGE